MNAAGILREIANLALLVAVLAFICFLLAIGEGARPEAIGFSKTMLIGGLFGAIIRISLPRDVGRSGPREGVGFALIFWIAVPLLTAMPFLNEVSPNGIWWAVFEASAALTTTGAADHLGQAGSDVLAIWRSMLHMLGGVASAILAAVVFAALNLTGPGVHRSYLFTMRRDDVFAQIDRVALAVTAAYCVVAALIFIAAWLEARDPILALVTGISAVTTGDVRAGLDTPVSVFTPPVLAIILVGLVAGASNVGPLTEVRRSGLRSLGRDADTRATLVLLGLGGLLTVLVSVGGWGTHLRAFADGVSLATTSGLRFSEPGQGVDALSPVVQITLILIGGSALSTAGGIKAVRFLVLIMRLRLELYRLAFPHSSVQLVFRGRSQADGVVLAVWVYLIGYLGVFVFGALGLAMNGFGVEAALQTSAGALSNAGIIMRAGLAGIDSPGDGLAICLSLLMALGRAEVLAVAVALAPDFWKR